MIQGYGYPQYPPSHVLFGHSKSQRVSLGTHSLTAIFRLQLEMPALAIFHTSWPRTFLVVLHSSPGTSLIVIALPPQHNSDSRVSLPSRDH